MALTIGETIQQLQRALRDYIEATYHVSHPVLVAQRRALLEEIGVIHQRPYLESTPRYKTGSALRDLGLDVARVHAALLSAKHLPLFRAAIGAGAIALCA